MYLIVLNSNLCSCFTIISVYLSNSIQISKIKIWEHLSNLFFHSAVCSHQLIIRVSLIKKTKRSQSF